MERFLSNKKDAVVTSDRILYTPSLFARSALMHIQEIGTLTAKKPHTAARSDLQSYLFFMVDAGSGKLVYGNETYPLKKDDCVFIDCRVPHAHTTDEKDLWTLRWCHFNGPMLPLVYGKYVERGGPAVFTPEHPEQYRRLWNELYDDARGGDHIRDMRINDGLNRLLTLVMDQSRPSSEASGSAAKKRIVEPVVGYLEEHYGEKITLDALAARFFINKYYLSRIFKEQIGVPIMTYLLNVRITRAKQMLRFTDKTIEEIGLECGIGLLHYFSRVFSAVEGVAPSVYRKRWRSDARGERE